MFDWLNEFDFSRAWESDERWCVCVRQDINCDWIMKDLWLICVFNSPLYHDKYHITRFLPIHSPVTHSSTVVSLPNSKLQRDISSHKVFALYNNYCLAWDCNLLLLWFLKHSLNLTFLQLCFTSCRRRNPVMSSQYPLQANMTWVGGFICCNFKVQHI